MAVISVEREMNGGTAIKETDKLNLIDISDFVTKSKVCFSYFRLLNHRRFFIIRNILFFMLSHIMQEFNCLQTLFNTCFRYK